MQRMHDYEAIQAIGPFRCSYQFLRAAGAPGGGRGLQRHAKIDFKQIFDACFLPARTITKIFSKRFLPARTITKIFWKSAFRNHALDA